MQMWLWTLNHLQMTTDPTGGKLYHGQRQGVTFSLADALCWLLASRYQILDVLELEANGPSDPVAAEGLDGTLQFFSDLCHAQAAAAAGEVSRICAELVFGYNRHPTWNDEGHTNCFLTSELEELEGDYPRYLGMALDVLPKTARIRARPDPAPVAPATTTSCACKASWSTASAARAWPRIAPPKRSAR